MKYRVVVTLRAEQDSDEGYLWWARHRSTEQASRWFRSFLRVLDRLESNPERFASAPESGRGGILLQEAYFGVGRRKTHRVVFTIREDRVYVLAVRHLARGDLGDTDIGVME